jgi:2-methylisocitrate lyase-like PEP mutase family enzyme
MDMTIAAKGRRFQDLHYAEEILLLPNPWDRGTTRLLEHLGFDAVATTSAGFANAQGLPDGAVTKTASLSHAADIAGATSLPVSADLENCYSHEPEGVAATIAGAIETGIVGCSIEDATGDPDRPIYEFELALERVIAAVEAARGAEFPFTLTARAEGFLYGRPDLGDAVARLQAFATAGASVAYAPGIKDLDSIRTLVNEVPIPVNVLARPEFTVADLQEIGVARVSIGSGLSRAALAVFSAGAREVLEAGTFGYGLPDRVDTDFNAIFRESIAP